MVKEFENNIDDFSEGDFGRCEGVGPSNAPARDGGDDNSDSSDGGNDEEDPEKELDGTETQEKCIICES